jgi:Flp pilus assembly protein TadD
MKSRFTIPSSNSSDNRAERLADIRLAIRLGFFDRAERALAGMDRDADCLNLLGVIEEARHAWKSARRCYGKAIRIDRSHAAAQQNMRRMYELAAFGWSREAVALGDERPALFELLREREAGKA